MTWLVRLGTERGKGAHLSAHGLYWPGERVTHVQRWARRFDSRDLAVLLARDCGGRVVRLRRKR